VAKEEPETHWIEVKITSSGELAEALAEVLGRYVSNGVVIEAATRFNPHTQEHEPTGEVVVSGYLAFDEQYHQKKKELETALWHLQQIADLPEPQYRPIQDEDWMAAWKKHFSPIPINNKLLILPAWKDISKDETKTIIRINPAMAFGTGSHPTTQLCLRLLIQNIIPNQNVIDVGCGSGILSITALKLGASHVLAVDIDEQAITSTLENAELNEISSDQLEVGKGSVEEIRSGRFTIKQAPLVLVNILAPVIIHLFSQGLGELVLPRGKLLLSGILKHQEVQVINSARQVGFSLAKRLQTEDWVSLAMVRSPI